MNKNNDLIQKLSNAINDFGINLIKNIHDRNRCNNIISPISLSTVMGIAHLGSKQETNNEIRQFLGYIKHNISDEEAHNSFKNLFEKMCLNNPTYYTLCCANRVFAQKETNILDSYIEQLQFYYYAALNEVDFINSNLEAIKIINNWVAVNTKEKIKFIIENPLPSNTKFIIANAVYFKSKWTNTFSPEQTFDGNFYNKGSNISIVQMMYKSCTEYNFITSKEIEAEIIELPYTDGCISMFIILPFDINGLEKTLLLFSEELFNSDVKMMSFCKFNLYLPKFIVEKSYSLGDEFNSLGLVNTFTENADLSGITTKKEFKLYDIVHKVVLEVNENGCEAVAVTGVTVTDSCGYKPLSKEFKVDHPFLFVIRDKKNNVNLFFGIITEVM